jgi:peptide/nickel transport system permease protein
MSSLFIQQAAQRVWRSLPGRMGASLTGLILLAALLAPVLRPYDPSRDRSYLTRLRPPSLEHWFGTDALGRDLFTLVWYGLQTSLLVGLASVTLGLLIGTGLGLVAGYWRGPVEASINWLTDILLAFPPMLLAIALVTVTGPSLGSVILALGVVQIPVYIRLSRSMVLSLREQEFVQAAIALGATPQHIVIQHILPACLAPLLVQATLSLGTAALEAASLGFLGLGIQPPQPELGTLLADAFKGGYSLSAPWTTLFPGFGITVIVLAFNLLGDGLRDSLNPVSS